LVDKPQHDHIDMQTVNHKKKYSKE